LRNGIFFTEETEMKKWLLNVLTCPACLPNENGLDSRIIKEDEQDILKGALSCPRCGKAYRIEEGIAFLDPARRESEFPSNGSGVPPARAGSKYETASVVSSYLWSHYGDILGDPEASSAYREWADLMAPCDGMVLDAGCAVGRFTFEMSLKSDRVVGVDNSVSFVRCARKLMADRLMRIELKEEGFLTREETLYLPERWDSRNVEFIVADAQALPFPSGAFSGLASLNLIDKVPLPVRHLKEIYRLAAKEKAQFLLSDPFSWSEEVADEKDWLGGTRKGPFAGRGMENIMKLLRHGTQEWSPPWRVEAHGPIWWKIRTHANHFELIRSGYVKAVR